MTTVLSFLRPNNGITRNPTHRRSLACRAPVALLCNIGYGNQSTIIAHMHAVGVRDHKQAFLQQQWFERLRRISHDRCKLEHATDLEPLRSTMRNHTITFHFTETETSTAASAFQWLPSQILQLPSSTSMHLVRHLLTKDAHRVDGPMTHAPLRTIQWT